MCAGVVARYHALAMALARYVFSGGGTGGHLFPGLAVANALRRREADAEFTFFTTSRALDRELLANTEYAQVPQPVQPMTMRPWRWPAFLLAYAQSVAAARRWLRKKQPRAVLGLGGYAAAPPVIAARQLGIRTAILNPDAIPGRANQHLATRADLVVLQWDASREHFPKHVNSRTLGCPIRSDFAGTDAAEGRRRFGLDAERPVLLVTGASQGARSVNETLRLVWPEFVGDHAEWQLLHLTGAAEECSTRVAYEQAGVPATVLAFTREMAHALAAADVVISRAGASTLAELTALGKPAILLPYPYHRDRHQHANAQVLVDAGAALMIEDERDGALNRAPVREALEQLANAPERAKMAAAAEKLGRLRAAEDVAGWMSTGELPANVR